MDCSLLYEIFAKSNFRILRDSLKSEKILLKKCRNKFDCLIHEMLIIKDLKPTLNMQLTLSALSFLHDHKETKCLLSVFTHIQIMMKQSLCLDNDGSTIETSDSISVKLTVTPKRGVILKLKFQLRF